MSQEPESSAKHQTFSRILSGAGMLTVARVAGDLASALLFISVSRAFGVEGTGLYAYAFAVAQIAQLLVDFGFVDYGLREYSRTGEPTRQRILANAVSLQLGFFAVVFLGLWVYLRLTNADFQTASLVLLLALYQILLNFFLMLITPAISSQRMAAPALTEFVFRVGGTLVAIGLITIGDMGIVVSLSALPLSALGMVIASVYIATKFNGPLRLGLNRDVALPMMRPAATFAASSVIVGLYAKLGLIILTFLDGKAAAGIFATGLKLIDLGMAPLLFLGIAVFPRLARSFNADTTDMLHIAAQYVRLTFILGVLVCWGMVFVVPPILPYLLGPDFAEAGPAVMLMGGVALLTALDSAAYRLLWATHQQDRRLRIQVIGLVVNIILNFSLIPFFGVTGAIAAAFLTMCLMLGLAAGPIISSLPSEHWKPIVRACLLPALFAFVVGLALLLLSLPLWFAAVATLLTLILAGKMFGLLTLEQLRQPG
jgi:O-antigen/teichoic acid export membrane protein